MKKILIGLALAFSVIFGAQVALGALPANPAVFETYLASSQGTVDTTLTLASVTLRDGTTLSGYTCFTVDSNTTSLEYECGTLTGTTLSGITRGIDAHTGTSTSVSLQYAHRRGADVKVTDYPTLTILGNMMSGLENLPGILNYANIPTLTKATQLATKGYADALVAAGVATSSESNFGGVWLATAQQQASSTDGSPNKPYVLQAKNATDTPNTATRASRVIVSDLTGYLKTAWLNLATQFDFTGTTTYSGAHIITSATTSGAIKYFGDGSDGDVTYSSGTTTLTRDMFYNNLTINTGATVTPASWKIYVKNTLIVNGGIDRSGVNGGVGGGGSLGLGGTGGTGGTATSSKSVFGWVAGAGGSSGVSGNTGGGGCPGRATGAPATDFDSLYPAITGGQGGAGQSGSSCAGQNLAAAPSATAASSSLHSFWALEQFFDFNGIFHVGPSANGGAGGGEGLIDNGSGGGGGGGATNGGTIWLDARIINIGPGGLISANGGVGGKGGNGSANNGGGGGGGGGGAGGLIVFMYDYLSNLGSVTVTGGLGGIGGTANNGAGTVGVSGVTGSTGTIYYF